MIISQYDRERLLKYKQRRDRGEYILSETLFELLDAIAAELPAHMLEPDRPPLDSTIYGGSRSEGSKSGGSGDG